MQSSGSVHPDLKHQPIHTSHFTRQRAFLLLQRGTHHFHLSHPSFRRERAQLLWHRI
jgi:hypothetical protein